MQIHKTAKNTCTASEFIRETPLNLPLVKEPQTF